MVIPVRLYQGAREFTPNSSLPLDKFSTTFRLPLAFVHPRGQRRDLGKSPLDRIPKVLGWLRGTFHKLLKLTQSQNSGQSNITQTSLTNKRYRGILCTGSSRYPSRFNWECRGFILHLFIYVLIRFLWPEVICAEFVVTGSGMTVGPAIEANDNPTNCAVLDEGESEDGGGAGVARSDTQYLIR